jgi:hypothetical protein
MGPSGSTAIENCRPFFLMQDGRAKKIRWRANICKVVEQTFKKKNMQGGRAEVKQKM